MPSITQIGAKVDGLQALFYISTVGSRYLLAKEGTMDKLSMCCGGYDF